MPRPKKLSQYPKEYWDTFITACTEGSLTVECVSVPQAKRLRNHLYMFRMALRKSNEPLADAADELTLEIDGRNLIIHKHTAVGANELRAALGDQSSE